MVAPQVAIAAVHQQEVNEDPQPDVTDLVSVSFTYQTHILTNLIERAT